MPISWNEIRHNALAFSKEWATESREEAEAKTFWDEFFRVFGIDLVVVRDALGEVGRRLVWNFDTVGRRRLVLWIRRDRVRAGGQNERPRPESNAHKIAPYITSFSQRLLFGGANCRRVTP